MADSSVEVVSGSATEEPMSSPDSRFFPAMILKLKLPWTLTRFLATTNAIENLLLLSARPWRWTADTQVA